MAETFVRLLRQNVAMPRQHLRALFSDSSSSALSKRGCFAATWLGQTQSKILPKHHLSAARSLWQTQSKDPLETLPLRSKVLVAESVEDLLETLILCCQHMSHLQRHARKIGLRFRSVGLQHESETINKISKCCLNVAKFAPESPHQSDESFCHSGTLAGGGVGALRRGRWRNFSFMFILLCAS